MKRILTFQTRRFCPDWSETIITPRSQLAAIFRAKEIVKFCHPDVYNRLARIVFTQKNIEERLEELNIQYRRQRQSAITSELLDVVAGFEALTKD